MHTQGCLAALGAALSTLPSASPATPTDPTAMCKALVKQVKHGGRRAPFKRSTHHMARMCAGRHRFACRVRVGHQRSGRGDRGCERWRWHERRWPHLHVQPNPRPEQQGRRAPWACLQGSHQPGHGRAGAEWAPGGA